MLKIWNTGVRLLNFVVHVPQLWIYVTNWLAEVKTFYVILGAYSAKRRIVFSPFVVPLAHEFPGKLLAIKQDDRNYNTYKCK